jgi:redox-sensitive bicupin YhaK (pirin superfamily)
MTAGSGIIHQEMPKGDENGRMYGFQLWANLPSGEKMMDPRYRDIANNQIPEVKLPNDISIKIISGEISGVKGPVKDIVIDPEFLDITVPANTEFTYLTKQGNTVLAYVIEGQGYFCRDKDPFIYEMEGENYFDIQRDPFVENGTIVLFDEGEEIVVFTEKYKARFLLISGKPLNEPVAWYGPIVMNTQEELQTAFNEYRQGTFIKYKGRIRKNP